MQFEDFDKKVKDAADHHHAAYDEKAWGKMEKLLDKHLPQKEDNRRRFIFFLLLFLLAGGGTWLMISKPWQGDKKIATINPVAEKDPVSKNSTSDNTIEKNNTPVSTNNTGADNNNTEVPSVTMNDQPVNNTVGTPVNNLPAKTRSQNKISGKEKEDQTSFAVTEARKKSKRVPGADQQKNDKAITANSPVGQNPVTIVPGVSSDMSKSEPVANTTKPVVLSPVAVATEKPVQKEDPVIAKTDIPESKTTEAKKKNDKTKRKNSLFFTLSTGPDLSFVGSGNSSKTKLMAGAGIGFTYKERFTLRTGFYSGRKVYSARASDYKAPPAFYQFYPYLERVDANCKVYEIPVSVSYNFGKKQNFFVSAGISSLLMKEESYDYLYKYTPTGNTYSNTWTIKNENSHYFSVGTLSAGYKHNIGKRISVMAEPYIKIPFAGVGYGKVKLNSGGVLFTVGIKVF
ncbi:MAG: hypothetical protein HOP10_10585 [Chitinophagaceae bacterium]|nr:hypothetical protein [Chitinophagaceae bacterium]